MKKQYLGDGVYLTTNERFAGDIKITTGNAEGTAPSQIIYLNRTMLADALALFDEDLNELMAEIHNKVTDCKHCE